MDFLVNRKSFIEALTVGGAMAGKSKSLAILDYAKITIERNQMVVSSTDNEVYVTKRVYIKSHSEDVTFCAGAGELMKALKMLRDEDILAEVSGSNLTILHKNGRMKFSIADSENFPIMEKKEPYTSFVIEVEGVFKILDIARRFVASDNLRPVMCGVYCYMEGNRFGVCASDGHKMFCDSVCIESDFLQDTNVIIPSTSCQSILNTINGAETMKVSISERNITMAVDNARVSCRLIDGKYPNFNSVIPRDNANSVSVNKKELGDSINRASLFSNTQSQLLSFEVKGMGMSINAEDIDFNKGSKEMMAVHHVGDDITIGLKCDIMSLCIGSIESEDISIEMSSPERAVVYKDESNPNRVVLQMPMMLNK